MSDQNTRVRVETNHGAFTIELNSEKAPKSVANFLSYVRDGFYDGTIFHRVIKDFMVQGGGMTADMEGKKTKRPVRNEADNGLKNLRGSVAMARTNDPHSATAQFFVNTVDNDFLNHSGKSPMGYGYCVFGMVTEGMETIDAIREVETGNSVHHQDVPTETVEITSAVVVE